MEIVQYIALNHLLHKLSIHNYESVFSLLGTGQDIFTASEAELRAHNCPASLITAIKNLRSFKEYEAELKILEEQRVKIFTFYDDGYPLLLREIPSPPVLLYCAGELKPDFKAIAIVGAREYTDYGREITTYLAGKLAGLGIAIVSGLARGIDFYAHTGACEAGGYTIGVSGCGIDDVYPKQNRDLYEKILAHKGCIITEFPPKTEVRPYNFPRRNRIISGLSLGVLVTEARIKSGSLITTRFAIEQNREVFAVPGSIFNEMSQGPNDLIKRGAKIISDYNDILEELFPQLIDTAKKTKACAATKQKIHVELGKDEQSVISYLDYTNPKHLDDLIFEVDMNVGELTQILISLEMKKVIKELPGNYYLRNTV